MAKIKIKRSSTQDATPTLDAGELAVNFTDNKVFISSSDSNNAATAAPFVDIGSTQTISGAKTHSAKIEYSGSITGNTGLSNNQLVTKSQVDNLISSASTSAIEYKGTVEPNAESATIADATLYIITDVGTEVLANFPGATTLEVGEVFTSTSATTLQNDGKVQEIEVLLAGATGDYYKVITRSGYVIKNGETTGQLYVNPSDSLLYNGTTWDIVDNTNSTITSTLGSIAVSGSPNTGYSIDVSTVDGGTFS